jgi:hypothetical protein
MNNNLESLKENHLLSTPQNFQKTPKCFKKDKIKKSDSQEMSMQYSHDKSLMKQLNISRISDNLKSSMANTKNEKSKKQKLYLGFNKKERNLIDQAFKIVNMREQEKRAGREFKKEVVREQVEKTKDIFFMGITKGLIDREQTRMKAKIDKEEQTLKDYEKEILEDNLKSKEKFGRKKKLADDLEKEANKISNQKNKVVEELKKKSKCYVAE